MRSDFARYAALLAYWTPVKNSSWNTNISIALNATLRAVRIREHLHLIYHSYIETSFVCLMSIFLFNGLASVDVDLEGAFSFLKDDEDAGEVDTSFPTGECCCWDA